MVLLDEPTTGLDVHAEELVIQALTQLMAGRTVVMTTHQPALASLATRTVRLHRGTIADPPAPAPTAAPASATDPKYRPTAIRCVATVTTSPTAATTVGVVAAGAGRCVVSLNPP